jgi:hypothetical protein
MDSFIEYVIAANPTHTIDIFFATQNATCIKPRLGKGKQNQYLVHYHDPNDIVEYYTGALGTRLKKLHIRPVTFKQKEDFTLLDKTGWTDTFLDLKLASEHCIQFALENKIKYDGYLRVRPDLLYTYPIILDTCSPNTFYMLGSQKDSIADHFFLMDELVMRTMTNFYNWYSLKIETYTSGHIDWKNEFNCETCIAKFLDLHKVAIATFGHQSAFVVGWLISDYKDAHMKRLQTLEPVWQDRLCKYCDHLVPCTFDL